VLQSIVRLTEHIFRRLIVLMLAASSVGCGTTRERRATDQLLLSDAVDRSVSQLDFSPFRGEKIFLDTKYLTTAPAADQTASANYVISSIRQQMFHHGCLLQQSEGDADYIAEARIGTLGSDGHEVNFGIPASNTINTAATVISSVPGLPAIPEISFARRTDNSAAAKVALFAYRRTTKEPVWQSGLSLGRSKATGRWILGVGPFESGTIHQGTIFAGGEFNKKKLKPDDEPDLTPLRNDSFRETALFDEQLLRKSSGPKDATDPAPVMLTQHQEAAVAKPVTAAGTAGAAPTNPATTPTPGPNPNATPATNPPPGPPPGSSPTETVNRDL